MYKIPNSPQKLRQRASQYLRAIKKEKKDTGFYGDGYGKRFLIGGLLLHAGETQKALEYYRWYAKEFPDDSVDPLNAVFWALALLRVGQQKQAEAKLMECQCEDIYMVPRLLGQNVTIDEELLRLVGPNDLEMYSRDYWPKFSDEEKAWIEGRINSDRFRLAKDEYFATHWKLARINEREERVKILERWRAFSKKAVLDFG